MKQLLRTAVFTAVALLPACNVPGGNAATRYCPFAISQQMANDGMTGSTTTSPAECPIGITTPGDSRYFTAAITDPNNNADHNINAMIFIRPNSNYPDGSYYTLVQAGWFLNTSFIYESDPQGGWQVGLGGFTSPQRDSGDAQILSTRQMFPESDEGYALLPYQYVPQGQVNADKQNVFVGDVVTLTLTLNASVYPNATWKWYRDGIVLSVTAPTFTQQYTTAGSHSYAAAVTASNGKSATFSKLVYWQATGHK